MLNWVIRTALSNRLVVLGLACAMLIYGALAARQLQVDVLPDLTRPRVVILTECGGLAPEEVETLVTIPLENAARQAAGVEAVRSSSDVGLSVIYVEFDWGQDPIDARQFVQERITAVTSDLPPNVHPELGPITSLLGQVMIIGLWTEDGQTTPIELRTHADWVIRTRLRATPGVAQVITMGGGRKQFQVLVDPHRLHFFDVSLHDVEQALSASNLNVSGGYLRDGRTELLVRGLGRVRTVEDIRRSVVRQSGQRSVLIRDVARVTPAAEVKRGDSFVNGKPAVVITIQKQPGADTRQLTEGIDQALAELRESLPPGTRLEPTYRQREFIDYSIDNVSEAVRDGALLVVIVLILFLLNIRTTLITLTAIPLSILTTALVFRWQGVSINVMTLGGIAVALGELVDDAIVDVENIFRRLRENRQRPPAEQLSALRVIYGASSEVRGAILISTLMVVLVFAPLFGLAGMSGRMFVPLATAYVVSILASTVVSLTVTPALSYFLLTRRAERGASNAVEFAESQASPDHFSEQNPGTTSGQTETERESWVVRLAQRAALPLIRTSLRPTGFVLALGTSFLLTGVALVGLAKLGREFLPAFDEGAAQVNVILPPGVSLETTTRVAAEADRQFEQLLATKEHPKRPLRWFTCRMGRAEDDEHVMGVNISEYIMALNHESGATREEVITQLRAALAVVDGVEVEVEQPIAHLMSHMLSGVTAQIAIKVVGDDMAELRKVANSVKRAIEDLPGINPPVVEPLVLIPQLRIEVKRQRLAAYGVTAAQVQEMVETALNGRVVSTVIDGQRSFDLLVRFEESARINWRSLERLPIELPDRSVAPLSELARVYRANGPNIIKHDDARRRVVVRVNTTAERDLGSAVRDIRRRIKERVALDAGVFIQLSGQFEEQQQAERRLLILGAVSVCGIFVLLYQNFHSVNLALQVLVALPLAMVGGVASLYLTGQALSVAGIVGFISLGGIAARNGILLIEAYERRAQLPGGATRARLIEASLERLSPVLMTALTTGVGLLPLVIGGQQPGKELLYPVATVIVGGLVTSTLAELLLRPGMYQAFRRG